MANKVLLMILDGWGNGRKDASDVISTVHPAYISKMSEEYPHAELRTDGENVGLPEGQMGNSEVGHLNIGAGHLRDIVGMYGRNDIRLIVMAVTPAIQNHQ